ncbi:MAG: hypothetical protein GEV04_14290 [Actinophytocola sp.]|nr:hypothetical protein [Actinophytocola sp.]
MNDAATELDLLAVYGTLMPGASAWSLLQPLVAEDEGACLLPGTLFDTLRGYPAFLPGDGPGAPARLVRLGDPDAALARLDHYEGPEYRRSRITVADGSLCWVYVWIAPLTGMPVLPDGWLHQSRL